MTTPAAGISHRFELLVVIRFILVNEGRSPMATAATARMGKATWGMRKPAAKRMEVVEPLFAHGAAESVWLRLRSWRRGRGVPRGAGVSLPGAGRILAIDA